MEHILEKRLAEVLKATKFEFVATMIADRVAVAVDGTDGLPFVGYISTEHFAELMTQGKLVSDAQFNKQYGQLLRSKVLENYQRAVEFVLQHTSTNTRARKNRALSDD